MPMTRYKMPPERSTFEIGDEHKQLELPLLVNSPIMIGDELCHEYDLEDLHEFTYNLMYNLRIPYRHIRSEEDKPYRKLADFSEEEKRLYYPFAFVLACLDGNAFRAGDLNYIMENGDKIAPTPDTITGYIPDAYYIIKSNSGTLDEVREIIATAAKSD